MVGTASCEDRILNEGQASFVVRRLDHLNYIDDDDDHNDDYNSNNNNIDNELYFELNT